MHTEYIKLIISSIIIIKILYYYEIRRINFIYIIFITNNGDNMKELIKSVKFNIYLLIAYLTVMLLISPLIPGVVWFNLGDFTLTTVNYYHVLMIPLAFLLMFMVSVIMDLGEKLKRIFIYSNIPLLIVNILGLILYYPSSTQVADYVLQGLRDVWMILLAIILLIFIIIYPIKNAEKFKKIWGAYFLLLFTIASATIAGFMGMIYEYGNLYGFSSIPFFNSMVNSWGGLQTFLGNLLTSHSHEMLPAVMGGIVALFALYIKYENLDNLKRNFVNVSFLISLIGTVSMTVLYIISSFGTYSIPTIFTSGPSGMNGLALDDSQTGLIGIGAMLALIGIWYIIIKDNKKRLYNLLEISTWIFAVFVLIGFGYGIEFNESFFGFGNNGTAPSGGPGYLFDQAYMNAHLVYAFFLMPFLAGIILAISFLIENENKMSKWNAYIYFAGLIFGADGALMYVLTLQPYVEEFGMILIILALIFSVIMFTLKFFKNDS